MAKRAGHREFLSPGLILAIAFALVIGAEGAVAADPPAVKPKGVGSDNRNGPPQSVPIPGQYIVTLEPGVSSDDFAAGERGRGNQVIRVYHSALNGFAGELNAGDVARLRADPRVKRVEQNATVSIDATQSNPTWGLDRIDQRLRPVDNSYTYSTTASGVTAYVIDTGIRATHSDLGGRVVAGFDAVGGVSPPTSDCNGHGTHVSGTIGGATYGVAKGVTLVAVRVLNCSGSGTYDGVIAGIDWVTANHQAGAPAVANMSLGGGLSSSLNDAVTNSVADGVVYAVAAGNSNADACSTSPAATPTALTVAATDSSDARASFSNYGSCVDIFAPGVNITSDWNSSDTGTNTISGTSMATPHVAGVAALTLASNPGATVSQVTQLMLSNATLGWVTDPGGSTPNRLLYVGSEPSPPPPPPPPPPANDNFSNAAVLTGATGTTSGSSVNATKQAGEPNHAGNAGGASIWYRITPTVSGIATIDTTGSGFDTLLGVYTGSSVSGLTTRASNDDLSYPLILQSLVQLSVTAGVPYYIAVDGWNGASGAVTLNWDVTGSGTTTTTTTTSTTTTSTTTTTTSTSTTTTTTLPTRTISIADASVFEGRSGRRTMSFRVSLSSAAPGTVTVHYATANGTATSGSDYRTKSGTLSISAGTTSATIGITVYGDRTPEPDETFTVNLSNPTGGPTIADGTAVGTIVNDD